MMKMLIAVSLLVPIVLIGFPLVFQELSTALLH